MKKILVTTDLSESSKAAFRFAQQWASQEAVALTILHSIELLHPTSWRNATYAAYEKRQIDDVQGYLERFVDSMWDSTNIRSPRPVCVAVVASDPVEAILRFAVEQQQDLIAVSVRGAGTLGRLFGTTVTKLINEPPVPVVTVPVTYQAAPITHLMYASDLTQLEPEVNRVAEVAKPLNATVDLVHFTPPSRPTLDPEIIRTTLQKFTDCSIAVHIRQPDLSYSVVNDFETALAATNASLLILFTTQREGFFQHLFSPSMSADYAIQATVPVLVFNKLETLYTETPAEKSE